MHTLRFQPLVLLISLLIAATILAAELPPGLDASDVPSGILLEPGPRLSGLHRHDGLGDDPRVTTGLWRQMLFELRKASLADQGWPSPRDLQANARASTPTHVVPITILDVAYERLPTETRPGMTVNARKLEDGRVFAAAPLRETTYHGEHVIFAFDPAWMIGAQPQAVEMDAGDGLGWRPLRNGRLDAQYTQDGEIMVHLKAVTSDGSTRTARFPLRIAALAAPAPHDTLQIQATVDYAGAYASGSAYVYLADNHTELTHPVVVVEGFDLDDTMGWEELYELLNREQLIETLRSEGFDAVVLDFDSATEPIQRNAFVLTELLTQIKTMLPADRTSVLIGASMGGLVSRFAMGWLENQGIEPGIRTWISFDSPQRGADIPLGMQHWLEFFQDEAESAAFLLSRLDTPASRQMLLLHHDATNGTVAGPDPLRPLFVQHLESVGLPSCRRVAIVNGSGTMTDQGFSPGEQLIRYEYYSLLLDLKGNVWSVPDGATTRIFQGEQNLIWPLPDVYENIDVGGTWPWDGAPGGWRASMAEMDTTSVPYGDIEAFHDNHCFIPTISALDLVVSDPFHDVLGDPDLMNKTSFDALYIPTWNQEHVSITPESKMWFLDEIRAGITSVDETPETAGVVLRAWPNPFNPKTTFAFELAKAGRVELVVFDLRGRKVATLADGRFEHGKHEVVWGGLTDAGTPVAAGTLLARLVADDRTWTLRVVLVD